MKLHCSEMCRKVQQGEQVSVFHPNLETVDTLAFCLGAYSRSLSDGKLKAQRHHGDAVTPNLTVQVTKPLDPADTLNRRSAERYSAKSHT